jgi:hypothetical protein
MKRLKKNEEPARKQKETKKKRTHSNEENERTVN